VPVLPDKADLILHFFLNSEVENVVGDSAGREREI
jgi:hypothetical protein